jgi:hypothetical protein
MLIGISLSVIIIRHRYAECLDAERHYYVGVVIIGC